MASAAGDPSADRGTSATRLSGWLEAIAFVFVIGVLTIVYALAAKSGAHVVVFILYSMLIAGVAILIVTRHTFALRERLPALLREPLTWAVGFTNLVMEGSYFLTLVQIAPAEASLLVRFSIPLSLLLGFAILSRRPSRRDLAGGAVVTAGLALLAGALDPVQQGMSLIATLVASLMVTLRAFASEWHPHNRRARTIAEKLAVTGALILVSTVVCLPVVALAMALEGSGHLASGGLLPRIADFAHLPTVLLAGLVGAALFTAMNYLAFSAVVKIGTSGLLAASALMPPAALLVQALAAGVGLIAAPSLPWHLTPAFLLVIAGVAIMVRTQARR